jgi:membrane-associated protein
MATSTPATTTLAHITHLSHVVHAKLTPSAHTINTIHHLGTRFLVTPTDIFMAWLSLHTHLAYLVLFLGAYFEALVGPSFFIPGEIFLLSGAILAGTGTLNIWLVIFVLYAGAILGDTSSYWIGRAIGTSIFHERKKVLNLKNYHRIEKLVDKYGNSAIFFGRFVGPFSKVVPVAAGIFEVPFTTFLAYNIPGILIGVGQFIAVGYFFGDRYQLVLWIVERYSLLILLLLAALFVLYLYFTSQKQPEKKKHASHHSK